MHRAAVLDSSSAAGTNHTSSCSINNSIHDESNPIISGDGDVTTYTSDFKNNPDTTDGNICNTIEVDVDRNENDFKGEEMIRKNAEDEARIQKDAEHNDLLDEARVRKDAEHNRLYLLIMNTYASMIMFATHLITFESIISIGLSVYFTIMTYNRIKSKKEDLELNFSTDDVHSSTTSFTFDGSILSWTLLSFAIITPITSAVAMAFRRREQAIFHLMAFRTTAIQIYISHCTWDWEYKKSTVVRESDSQAITIVTTGRQRSSVDWLNHGDKVSAAILSTCDELTRILTLPSSSRGRHRMTRHGKKEAIRIDAVNEKLVSTIVVKRMSQLSLLCEILKFEGMPSNEASRIREWERQLLLSIESVTALKMYRTPQGLRSFARIFSMFLPPFYAPYYASVAIEINDSLGVALTFAIITAIALTALFETVNQLEDPFEINKSAATIWFANLDGIDVEFEIKETMRSHLQNLRTEIFPSSTGTPNDSKIIPGEGLRNDQ